MLKDLLSVRQLTYDDIHTIMDMAWANKQLPMEDWLVPDFVGKPAAIAMFEGSTRTQHSTYLAMKALGLEPIIFTPEGSSMEYKAESLFDTLDTLDGLGCHLIAMRHFGPFTPRAMADRLPDTHIINNGDGINAHPTQALIDLFTLLDEWKWDWDIMGMCITIIGDVINSRVAHSDAHLFTELGCNVFAVGPAEMIPHGKDDLAAYYLAASSTDIKEMIGLAHVIIPLRVQRERHAQLSSYSSYFDKYGLTSARLALAHPKAIVMAPGPINLGVEIDADVAYGPQSRIKQQVRNSIAVRAAIIQLLLKGDLSGKNMDGGIWG